ncbi:hypothetical protein EOM81_10060 [bacterium]|nr:hypothetical protein [bacterium]
MKTKKTIYAKVNDYLEQGKIDKHKVFREAGLDAVQTTNILKGKRTFSAEEYIAVCKVLKVNPDTFAD